MCVYIGTFLLGGEVWWIPLRVVASPQLLDSDLLWPQRGEGVQSSPQVPAIPKIAQARMTLLMTL